MLLSQPKPDREEAKSLALRMSERLSQPATTVDGHSEISLTYVAVGRFERRADAEALLKQAEGITMLAGAFTVGKINSKATRVIFEPIIATEP